LTLKRSLFVGYFASGLQVAYVLPDEFDNLCVATPKRRYVWDVGLVAADSRIRYLKPLQGIERYKDLLRFEFSRTTGMPFTTAYREVSLC
jgi:hypothetical protein